MNYKFQEIKIPDGDKIWLREVHEQRGIDVKATKVRLHGFLPKGYDPSKIDYTLLRDNRLTLLGLWYIEPNSQLFSISDKIIIYIRNEIIKNTSLKKISSKDISEATEVQLSDVEYCMVLVSDLGNFFSGATGRSDRCGFTDFSFSGDKAFDAYMSYTTLDDQMEQFYVQALRAREHFGLSKNLLQAPIIRPIEEISLVAEDAPRFSRLHLSDDLIEHIKYRWNEASLCRGADAFLAATILYGSILEVSLLAMLQKHSAIALSSKKAPKRSSQPQSIDDWSLADMLNVAENIGWISPDIAKHGHGLRDSRNLVHPLKQLLDKNTPDKHLADISKLVVVKVVDYLVKFDPKPQATNSQKGSMPT